jgi:hypothetical protein
MYLRIAYALLFVMPSISLAADCQDSDIFSEQLLSKAIIELVQNFGAAASAQAISSCEVGPGRQRQIKLSDHEQDQEFSYYRMITCEVNADPDEISCERGEGRKIKYRGTTIDTDTALSNTSYDDKQSKNYVVALDCFKQALQVGKVKIRKYNQLLDTTLNIPLAADSTINSIKVLAGFRRYIVNTTPERHRFSVELNKEYGCFIEPLK